MTKIQNYINGEQCDPFKGEYIENISPATEEVYSQCPNSTNEDVEKAVASAQQAFPEWSSLAVEKREKYIRRLAEEIDKRKDELAIAESKDTGKPIKLTSHVDIPRAVSNLNFYANAVTQFSSEVHDMPGTALNYTLRRPIGPVGIISPWNLPLYLFTWKIAPALAVGNTVVAKPSEVTPMTAYLFGQICEKVGLPKGVLNIIHGEGPRAAAPIVQHPGIKAVSFTGSTQTGRVIATECAGQLKKFSLELGGKNPSIVFADADLKKAAFTVAQAAFANQGQICLCGSRIYVQKEIYSEFKKLLLENTAKLLQGDPLDPKTDQGSLVSKTHFEKVMSYIEKGKSEGKLLCGGERFGEKGFFIQPTLFEGISQDSCVNQEEIFGPVATLSSFDSEDEVVKLANDTDYGLSANFWTSDLDRAHRVASALDAGIIWVNSWLLRDLRTPFGGMKSSGIGREGGVESLRFFTEAKNVCLRTR
jgi:aminomuconate-semialdehyde/2-hydroxymuconate-6-semialdehyde dehydrogenase